MVPKSASARWLAGVGAGVAVIALASIIVAVAGGTGDPPLLPDGTPQGTVQRYILGIDSGDFDTAYALLATDVQETCSLTDFRSQSRFRQNKDTRVRLEEVIEQGSGTQVAVRISSFSGRPLFDLSEHSYTVRFFTREGADGWRILEAPWPFPSCDFLPSRPAPNPPKPALEEPLEDAKA